MRTRNTPTNIPPTTDPSVAERVAELNEESRAAAQRRADEPSGFSDDNEMFETPDEVEQRMRDEHVAAQEERDAAEQDGFGEFLRSAVTEMPSTKTGPEERARRGEALRNAIDILGPSSRGGTMGGLVARSVTDIVYVAEWLLDSSTPVRIPRFTGEDGSDG